MDAAPDLDVEMKEIEHSNTYDLIYSFQIVKL